LSDLLNKEVVLKGDPVLNLRRCLFLSLASNIFLFFSLVAASLVSSAYGDTALWFKISSLGLFASLSLRFLIFQSASFVGFPQNFTAAVIQPSLFLLPFFIVSSPLDSLQVFTVTYFILAVAAAFLGTYLFTKMVNAIGLKAAGIPSIRMFRAFIANWAEGLEGPFEDILEEIGEEREVKFSAIAFKSGDKIHAAIIVTDIHPGPFKNIGSSPFPGLIQKAVERKLHCKVSVPHGISGHGFDLASQSQNRKVIKEFIKGLNFHISHSYATPFISLKKEGVTAGCQILGEYALLTLTLAPETMEDLPSELNDFIVEETRRRGLFAAVAVDAHNSIQGPFSPEKVVKPMKKAIAAVLKKALMLERSTFEVGAAKLMPKDLNVKNGLGPGGITVIVIKVENRKAAYVTIDGNNMVSGLREKMLSSLKEIGIDSGEIFTTDTHIVNAVVMTSRGYHPVGEVIDHERLIGYVKRATKNALRNLKPSEVSLCEKKIQGVKVVGEKQIDTLCSILNEASKRARASTLIFPALCLLLILAIILF
jgi:putative membrane protein